MQPRGKTLSNHAKFIEMTHYLSHFVFRFRHFAVLIISEETRENFEKIVTSVVSQIGTIYGTTDFLSFHRSSVLLRVSWT